MDDAVARVTPVRGTQSFVHTLSACWVRPGLTGIEILWRWVYGVPALSLMSYEAMRIVRATPLDLAALRGMSILDPMSASTTLADAASAVWPAALAVAEWLGPVLVVGWVVASAVGRTVLLRRVDPGLHARAYTLMALQGLRTIALGMCLAVWFVCLRRSAAFAVGGPVAAGLEPNLVLYSALVIVATLGLFTLWAVLSWALSFAPLLAMLGDLGFRESLAASARVGALRSKLVEINLVMGIVKIALIVLAMVFSATPLPFESISTPGFMAWWYAGVTVIYLIASDFFHVVQLSAYLELWRAYEPGRFPPREVS